MPSPGSGSATASALNGGFRRAPQASRSCRTPARTATTATPTYGARSTPSADRRRAAAARARARRSTPRPSAGAAGHPRPCKDDRRAARARRPPRGAPRAGLAADPRRGRGAVARSRRIDRPTRQLERGRSVAPCAGRRTSTVRRSPLRRAATATSRSRLDRAQHQASTLPRADARGRSSKARARRSTGWSSSAVRRVGPTAAAALAVDASRRARRAPHAPAQVRRDCVARRARAGHR